jgi:hypothetical protein
MRNKNIRLPQSADTDVQQVARSTRHYRYGYSRSSDCRRWGEPGQDYLTLAERESSLSFVLCDGVSQSYEGGFAARFVGDRLLDWLLSFGETAALQPGDGQRLLNQFMKELTKEASQCLQEQAISPSIQGLLREALSLKKEQGSATMYCGGRIDYPGTQHPNGRLLLVWQGDIRCRIWRDRNETTAELPGDLLSVRGQWNSVAGPVGGMSFWYCTELLLKQRKGELLLYTDGFQALDRYPRVTGELLSELLASETEHPSSDDISFLQVTWDFTSS